MPLSLIRPLECLVIYKFLYLQVTKFRKYLHILESQSLALYGNCFEPPSDWLLKLLREPIRGQLKTITNQELDFGGPRICTS